MAQSLLISGLNALAAALQAGHQVEVVWLDQRLSGEAGGLRGRLGKRLNSGQTAAVDTLPIQRAETKVLTGKIGHDRHQGVVARIAMELPDLEDVLAACETANGALVVTDHLSDPHNLGTMIRSAAALSGAHVLISRRRAPPFTDTVIRASAGVALQFPPVQIPGSVADQLLRLDRRGWCVLGLAADGVPLREVAAARNRNQPLALVVGSEGEGLAQLVRQRCHQLAAIPIDPSVESLNATVAAAVALAFLHP